MNKTKEVHVVLCRAKHANLNFILIRPMAYFCNLPKMEILRD